MKSGTTAADSDIMAESCVAESCASFEFVDDEPEGRVDDDDDEEEGETTEQEQHHQRSQPPSPPKLLVISSDGTKSSSAVCSPIVARQRLVAFLDSVSILKKTK